MKPKNSLGGQNNHGRMSGARSSRASSTIFNKLRKLDREISALDKRINGFCWRDDTFKINQKRRDLDNKRKFIRNARKHIAFS